MLRTLFLSCVALAATLAPALSQSRIQEKVNASYRLPGTTIPHHYNINLTTRIHNAEFDFAGTVDIEIEAVSTTQSIVLHHRQLTIEEITLTWNGGIIPERVSLLLWEYDVAREFLIITTDGVDLLAGNKYDLSIRFGGELRGQSGDYAGFYRSNYTNPDTSEQVWLAVTQFQATDARHGFPCYDEPALKATFTITINHGQGYTAVSNMQVFSHGESRDSDMVTTVFKQSPLMSTYLVAYIISDYQFTEMMGSNGVLNRIYAPAYRLDETEFALVSGDRILSYMASYFQVPYSLLKMDQFGIPQFAPGGMENWGIVTYRPVYLYCAEAASNTTKQKIATLISHEFAHQWFGNLVSPAWWDYLWLNEGFANLFEYYTTDRTHPEFRTRELMLIESVQIAMLIDASLTARPMTYAVSTPIEIQQLFDFISYGKSGSVLRMFFHAAGEAQFVKGLTIYLKARSFAASIPDYLFDVIGSVTKNLPSGVTMNEIMNTWTLQAGFPVVNVRYNVSSASFELTQSRFLTSALEDDNNNRYYVPINYFSRTEADHETHSESTVEYWMEPSDEVSVWAIPDDRVAIDSGEWYLINKGHTGYYRVNYDAENWQLLADELVGNPKTKIGNMNRAQLLDDSFNLARSGRLSINVTLDLLEYLINERDYFPWNVASRIFNKLLLSLSGTDAHAKLMDLIRNVIDPALTDLGTEDGNFYDSLTRKLLVKLACQSGHDSCEREIVLCTEQSASRQLIYAINAYGIEGVDNKYIRKSNKEQADIMPRFSHVAKTLDESVIDNLLSAVLNEDSDLTVVEQEKILTYISSNSDHGLKSVLEFLNEHPQLLKNQLRSHVDPLLESLSGKVVTQDRLTVFKQIVGKLTGDIEGVTKYLTVAEAEKKWTDDNAGKIFAFLKSK